MTMIDKNVVVTGASSGVDLAASILLAEQEARVGMVCRDSKRGWFMRNKVAKYAVDCPSIISSLTCHLRNRFEGWPSSSGGRSTTLTC
jgi:NAD(P)-dependent dehydrogenase (short-subunit alcohol dehydrogenase family)